MKQRSLALLLGAAFLSALVVACAGGTGSRGWAAPVTTDDLVLVSTGRGRLDGVDLDSLRALWRFPNDWSIPDNRGRLEGIYGPPVVSADGRVVFVADYNSRVYAFRPSDIRPEAVEKAPAGYVDFDDPIIGGIALDQASGRLYITAGDRLYAVRASELIARIDNQDATVHPVLLKQIDGEIWAPPLLDGDRIYIASVAGSLYALNASDGRELWRFQTDRALVGAPTLANGTVLVGGFDNQMHAIDASNGQQRWAFDADGWVWSRPVVDSSRVYFGDFDSKVHALDLQSGSAAWSLDLGKGAIRAGPVLAGNTLVVATEDGWLAGISTSSQSVVWQKKIGSGINADLVLDDDSVLLAPRGCVTLPGTSEKAYYAALNPSNGELRAAEGVCG